MSEDRNFPACFGPYLRYAIATDFKHFKFFDDKTYKLYFLAEFKKFEGVGNFRKAMKDAGFPVQLGPANDKTPYATVHTGKAAVLDSSALKIWSDHVSRVELSLPLNPSDGEEARVLLERWTGDRSPGSLLIGMLDYGCPFAAAHFLRSSASTRVFAIWDQNQGKEPVEIYDQTNKKWMFGEVPKDFKFGLEFRRKSTTVAGSPQMGLDEWTGLHTTPTGSIDEDGCYADARFTPLKFRRSHGAHVMDLFAGRIPPASRVGFSKPGQDRRDPPSWQPGTDPACRADVVFVQFPENCIQDHTGVWLKAYVEDGIRYILSCADPKKKEHIVINLSYGLTTGPHDGTAELEAALAAVVAEFNASTGKHTLEIVVAAGNAYLSDGHVVFKGANATNDVEWTWRLPPDNTVLCFAEVWMKKADAGSAQVALISPSGATRPVGAPVDWSNNRMWLLEVGPTVAQPNTAADEHGDYTIKVTGIGKDVEVNAYVARTDPNMNMRTGAKASRFVDAQWEIKHSAAASHRRNDGEFDKTGSLVCRLGTFNGLATGQVAQLHVAGGYIIENGRGSSYSSAGPARGDPLVRRKGPDFALACDESYALAGIRAGGNRSGSVFRLIGTSAAAPQLARHVANPPFPPPHPTNVPTDAKGIAKRGGGNIEPP
jgi:hypothetical protein